MIVTDDNTPSPADSSDLAVKERPAPRFSRILYPAGVILLGMLITHLFFTLMVYRSNLELLGQMHQIIDSGYLPVPNSHILPALSQPGTAFKGALFFTLTVGITLPLLVYLAAFAWEIGYRRSKRFLTVLSGFVIFLTFMLNRHGFNPWVTLWFLVSYFTLFKLSSLAVQKNRLPLSSKRLVTHLVLLGILAGMLNLFSGGTGIFITVRDHFLLSNPLGSSVTDFYYRYSPYPTEAIKPLIKKQLKICRIEGELDTDTYQKVENALLRYDFLPVSAAESAPVQIRIQEDHISFFVQGRRVLTTSVEGFIENFKSDLNRVSLKSDRNDITRRLLAFSLLYGLPLFLYAALFTLFRSVFQLFPLRKHGFYLSAAACLLAGGLAILALRLASPSSIPLSDIGRYLESPSPNTRTVALKAIARQGLDPLQYLPEGYGDPPVYTPERIWWTICLADMDPSRSVNILLELLDDPNPLVACKAYDALRRMGYRPAIDTIIQKLGTSRHWYVQGYAYQALRTLGWKQSASN